MHFTLYAIGKSMPSWVQNGFQDYAKRFPPEFHFQLVEIEAAKRHKNAEITRLIDEEGERMLAVIPKHSYVVALDIKGKEWDTETLAKELKEWQLVGGTVSFMIGGADGLSSACLKRADVHWSLSNLTFPHALVRIIVAEQLYRAWSLLKGHPYHRA